MLRPSPSLFRLALSLACLTTALQAADPFVDVTTKVAGMLKENALSVEATNDNFTDPAEGVGKKLRVVYVIDDSEGIKTCNENETLRLALAATAAGKKLTIRKATYGELPEQEDKLATGVELSADVTAKVKEAVADNRLSINAGNDALGGDPAFGVGKQLSVEYTVGGKAHTATANEGEDLALPASADGAGVLVIVKAKYGPTP